MPNGIIGNTSPGLGTGTTGFNRSVSSFVAGHRRTEWYERR